MSERSPEGAVTWTPRKRPPVRPQRVHRATLADGAPGSAEGVTQLQRAAGNRAVSGLLMPDRGSFISTAELATRWRRTHESRPWSAHQPGIAFRLPTAASIKTMMAAGEVPEAKIKDSIALALTRMEREKKGALLKTTDAVPDITKRLFPSPAKFDEVEFADPDAPPHLVLPAHPRAVLVAVAAVRHWRPPTAGGQLRPISGRVAGARPDQGPKRHPDAGVLDAALAGPRPVVAGPCRRSGRDHLHRPGREPAARRPATIGYPAQRLDRHTAHLHRGLLDPPLGGPGRSPAGAATHYRG